MMPKLIGVHIFCNTSVDLESLEKIAFILLQHILDLPNDDNIKIFIGEVIGAIVSQLYDILYTEKVTKIYIHMRFLMIQKLFNLLYRR